MRGNVWMTASSPMILLGEKRASLHVHLRRKAKWKQEGNFLICTQTPHP